MTHSNAAGEARRKLVREEAKEDQILSVLANSDTPLTAKEITVPVTWGVPCYHGYCCGAGARAGTEAEGWLDHGIIAGHHVRTNPSRSCVIGDMSRLLRRGLVVREKVGRSVVWSLSIEARAAREAMSMLLRSELGEDPTLTVGGEA